MSSYNFKKTPMEKVLHAFNRLGKEEFHKYIYDYGDVLLEEEEDIVKAYRNDRYWHHHSSSISGNMEWLPIV